MQKKVNSLVGACQHYARQKGEQRKRRFGRSGQPMNFAHNLTMYLRMWVQHVRAALLGFLCRTGCVESKKSPRNACSVPLGCMGVGPVSTGT